MKTMEQFWSELTTSKELEEAALKARNEKRLAEFLTENEVDGTAEAFEALVKEKKREACELSDTELEEAVGGKYGYADYFGVTWSESGYQFDKSKVRYLFNIDDRVIVDCWFRNLTGTVKDRIVFFYERKLVFCPCYYIEFDIDTSPDWYDQDDLAPL